MSEEKNEEKELDLDTRITCPVCKGLEYDCYECGGRGSIDYRIL